MRIASWNMNGYSARMKDGTLPGLLAEGHDVVCLQETRVSARRTPTVPLRHASWATAERAGYAGVCVLTREAPLQVLRSGSAEVDAEGRLLAVELPSSWIVSAYSPTFVGRPDREAYRMQYEEVLHAFVGKLMATGKPVILCGDLNVTATDADCFQADVWRGTPNHTEAERDAFRRLLSLGLDDVWRVQHPGVERYSWMQASRTPFGMRRNYGAGFRFDYILASGGVDAVSSDILVRHQGSDHVPVVAEFCL